MKKKGTPKYLILYRCGHCGNESGFTELDTPCCRFCSRSNNLTVVSKQKITADVIFARLKTVADRMMSSLTEAYDDLAQRGEFVAREEKDEEKEMLILMERVKKFKEKLYGLTEKHPKRRRKR